MADRLIEAIATAPCVRIKDDTGAICHEHDGRVHPECAAAAVRALLDSDEVVDAGADAFSFSVDDYVMCAEDRRTIVAGVLAAIASQGPLLVTEDGRWVKADRAPQRDAAYTQGGFAVCADGRPLYAPAPAAPPAEKETTP